MITTFTLNAAIDKTYYLSDFQTNQVNRVERVLVEPGGKGINVSKVLHKLKVPVTTSGIVAGYNGQLICSLLDKQGLFHQFHKIYGESRLCLNIISKKNNIQTEILEPGPTIRGDEWQAIQRKISELSGQSNYVIFSGSLPRGLDKDSYYDLILIAKRSGAKVILDTSGVGLIKALEAKPYLIKPNKDEFEQLVGRKLQTEADIIGALHDSRHLEIPVVIVTLGAMGALALIEEKIYKIEAPNIKAINPVGSGDAFTAGIAAGLENGIDIEETLRIATAAGAANALEEVAGNINLSLFTSFKDKARIEVV